MSARTAIIVVSVGTDHHLFDRLISWLTAWGGASRVDLRVQHGTSAPVPGARNVALVSHAELLSWMSEADCVVLHGGPGGMFDALRCGLRPLVVPRRASLGEHVDDHQVAFTRRMAAQGHVIEIRTAEALASHLDAVQPQARDMRDLTESLEALGPQVIAQRLGTTPQAALGPVTVGRRLLQSLRTTRESPARHP
jgi:UDP-N-acetylglucosamine transferase subunit ALG13